MTNNAYWGNECWWIIVIFAIILIWMYCGGFNNTNACATTFNCGNECGGCCR